MTTIRNEFSAVGMRLRLTLDSSSAHWSRCGLSLRFPDRRADLKSPRTEGPTTYQQIFWVTQIDRERLCRRQALREYPVAVRAHVARMRFVDGEWRTQAMRDQPCLARRGISTTKSWHTMAWRAGKEGELSTR